MNNNFLKEAFLEVLLQHGNDKNTQPQNYEDFWRERLDVPVKKKEEFKKLSGLFLPSVSVDYSSAKTKIMLVGAETAGWYPLMKRNKEGQALTKPAEFLSYQSLEDYIEKSMHRHAQVFENRMKKAKNDKGRTFYNYLRGLDKELSQIGAGYDNGGWVWSNLHCFDWGGKSPIFKKQIYQSLIKPVSQALLNIQIKILKPDFIVFLSGISAEKTRCEFVQGVGLPKQNHHESTRYLREFMVNDSIHCFRTHHPSARKRDAQKALTESQKLLRRLIESRASPNS